MKVVKWGNGLAVRLPPALVEELDLEEGDEVHLGVLRRQAGGTSDELSRQEAIAAIRRMRQLSRSLPSGWKFDRDEIYHRFGADSPGRKPYGKDRETVRRPPYFFSR